ncbi:unnamed protein product, partial [Iphiclides podalirius]
MGEKKLSKDRLKRLGNLLEDQMRKENFKVASTNQVQVGEFQKLRAPCDSIPDSQVPKHILDQYAKVVKKKDAENKQDAMTDSGVSSETENLEEEKCSKIKKLVLQYEKPDISPAVQVVKSDNKEAVELQSDINDNTNLESMDSLCASSETMRLERKNPHLVLTDTLKKALKQPLPSGPPPKKPPRVFAAPLQESKLTPTPETPEKKRKDTKKMLEKLEKVLQKREAQNLTNKHIYDVVEADLNQEDEEPIYDEPFTGDSDVLPKSNLKEKYNEYGSLSSWKVKESFSKSLEDLRVADKHLDAKIYDIPCEQSRPTTPDQSTCRGKTEFQMLRRNFETGFRRPETGQESGVATDRHSSGTEARKPPDAHKPALKPLSGAKKVWRSTENVSEGFRSARERVERQLNTATGGRRRFEKNEARSGPRLSLARRDSTQLDVDRENLNRLMTEIYETVSAACNMDDNRPGSFPTELSDGSTSEESVKLTRSLTEKRKNYVRRVSSRVAYLDPNNVKGLRFRHQTSICSYKSEVVDNPYSTFRSWKSFRASQSNLSRDKMADVTDDSFGLGGNESLEHPVSDDTDSRSIDEKTGCVEIGLPFEPRERGLFNVCLLVGMDYMGGRAYVKSVFPSQVKAPAHIENLVFPETLRGAQCSADHAQRYSLVLTDERGERSYGYCRRVLPEGATSCLPLCYCLIGKYRAPGFYYKVLKEIESLHGNSEVEINLLLQQLFESDFPSPGEELALVCSRARAHPQDPQDPDQEGGIARDLEGSRTITIKRPIEPRVDEDSFSVLLDSFGAGLVIKVFGSLLLERKVVVMGDQLSVVSSCLEALQAALYPLVWQQPLISSIPAEIQRDVLEAPLPILAGMLNTEGDAEAGADSILFEEGMLIDLTHPNKVLFYQGDESTILPTSSYKTLKTSLQMESVKQREKNEDTRTRNVMISEAFLRFFVDILGDFWRFFEAREPREGEMGRNGIVFDKEAFVRSAPSKQNQYFLEWFAETAMFNHFVQNMAATHPLAAPPGRLVDTPLPNFYELFQQRLSSRNKAEHRLPDSKNNYKSAVNKKVKMLKTKLRELVA